VGEHEGLLDPDDPALRVKRGLEEFVETGDDLRVTDTLGRH
jgi:hypothetical protein